jgi:DNA-directed RNA polymerase specialized sigma24 family protein
MYDRTRVSFDTTRWSVIAAVRGSDPEAARAALSTLCDAYWYPLYAFIRRWGADPEAARDLTQGFFASVLERRDIEQVRPERGRFRTFLLASVKHFLLNEAVRSRAAKRGGGVSPLPLAFDEAEGRYQYEPVDETTPETLFERRWALTVLERVIATVQARWQRSGRGAEFEVLKASLLGQGPSGGYAAAAHELGATEGAVKVAVHRLRKTFRAELRAAIAETVSDPADVDEELRYLERALGS